MQCHAYQNRNKLVQNLITYKVSKKINCMRQKSKGTGLVSALVWTKSAPNPFATRNTHGTPTISVWSYPHHPYPIKSLLSYLM